MAIWPKPVSTAVYADCAALQEAISEAPGRRADVDADAALDGDAPVIEGALEFEAAAANVFEQIFAEEPDAGSASAGTVAPGLSIFCSLTSTRPARMSACARSRLGTRPRSTSRTSMRVLAEHSATLPFSHENKKGPIPMGGPLANSSRLLLRHLRAGSLAPEPEHWAADCRAAQIPESG